MKVSVVTVTRNDGELLVRNIRSVYAQTWPDIEQVVVDGGNTLAVDYAQIGVDSCVRLFRREPKGVYEAINFGVDRAVGDVICLVHGNDFFTAPDSVERAVSVFESSPELDFIYGDVTFVSEAADGTMRRRRYYSSARFVPARLSYGFAPPHPSLFIRREAADKVGAYREDLSIASDFEMFLRLFNPAFGLRGRYVPGALVSMSPAGLSGGLNGIRLGVSEKMRALRQNGMRADVFKLFYGILLKLINR